MLTQWASTWQMISTKECVPENYKQTTPLGYSYYMSNTPIQQADHAKYLGVIIDKNLNWNEHTKQVVSKANRVRGFLQCNLKKCLPDVKVSCYLMLVHPIFSGIYLCSLVTIPSM